MYYGHYREQKSDDCNFIEISCLLIYATIAHNIHNRPIILIKKYEYLYKCINDEYDHDEL